MWLAVLAMPLHAEAPGRSLRPQARPVIEAPQPMARPVLAAPVTSQAPEARPAHAALQSALPRAGVDTPTVSAPEVGSGPDLTVTSDGAVAVVSEAGEQHAAAAPESPVQAPPASVPVAIEMPKARQLVLPSAPPPALRAPAPPPVMAPAQIVLPRPGQLALASAPPPALRAPAVPQSRQAEAPLAMIPVAPVVQPPAPEQALAPEWQEAAASSLRPHPRKTAAPVAVPDQRSDAFERVAPPPARQGAEAGDSWQAGAGPDRRPMARPLVAPARPAPDLTARFIASLRPEPRPPGLLRKARPNVQPETLEPVAAIIRPAPGTGSVVGKRGSVCGIPTIRGETISPIVGRAGGCGVANPVRITSVAGVALSQPSIVDCDTARALHTWVDRALKPSFGATGGGVSGLQIAGHYVCRTRNHKKGARLSEHSKGKAIDISAIILANGQKLSILRDYRGRNGKPIKAAHKAACGIFGTTLGPGSDGMHEDHLHFDTASHRNGPYCR